MNRDTTLDEASLDAHTKLGSVRWNGVYLGRIDWTPVSRLGDEDLIKQAQDRRTKRIAYREAIGAYSGLVFALRESGVKSAASRYRVRGQQLERRLDVYEFRIFSWLFSLLLDGVAGYGEGPGRAFKAYVFVIVAFSAFDWLITNVVDTGMTKLSWDEALVFSITSFHGRGFFPGFLSLDDWISRIAALEAIIGLFIELVLIATFSRRFLSD